MDTNMTVFAKFIAIVFYAIVFIGMPIAAVKMARELWKMG